MRISLGAAAAVNNVAETPQVRQQRYASAALPIIAQLIARRLAVRVDLVAAEHGQCKMVGARELGALWAGALLLVQGCLPVVHGGIPRI